MWGFGGKYYWGRRERRRSESLMKLEGIVVVFAWMSSEERHLKHYVDLYSSLGWDTLVCHSQFLNSFSPEKATLLAVEVLNELAKEIEIRPRPVVFASFSGGPKACMYKVLQIIDGKSEIRSKLDTYRLIRDCVTGHIYDSSPVDFVSETSSRFVVHPSILKISSPPKLATWVANGIASGLDLLFLSRFESQRADFWQTLYASVDMGAPYLLLCSVGDDLAPCETICNFAHRLEELGGDVTLVKWVSSPHVGHYREYPDEYRAAVTHLLKKAASIFSQRIKHLEAEMDSSRMWSHNNNASPYCHLRRAAREWLTDASRSSAPNDLTFVMPSSSGYHEGSDEGMGSIQHKSPNDGSVHLPTLQTPTINANGVLGQILFDICVPKNVDDWDIRRPSSSFDGYTPIFHGPRKHSHFNPIKCIKRSRL